MPYPNGLRWPIDEIRSWPKMFVSTKASRSSSHLPGFSADANGSNTIAHAERQCFMRADDRLEAKRRLCSFCVRRGDFILFDQTGVWRQTSEAVED